MKSFLAPLLALLALAAPALAQTRALPPGEIRANGDITFGNALKLGKRQGNKTVITPDTLQILGEGSTGDSSSFSVKAGGVGDARLLAQWMEDLKNGQQLQGVLRSQVSQVSIPTTVNRFTVSGCTTDGDGGRGSAYIRGTSTGPMAVQDAKGAWWQLAKVGVLDAGAYCLDLTGATDVSTALQAASNQAVAWGAKLFIPPGTLRLANTVTVDISARGDDQIGRFDISAAGRGLTVLKWVGGADVCALNLVGGSAFAGHANATVGDIMISGTGNTGRGICTSKLADLTFRDVFIQSMKHAYYLRDTLSTRWFGGTTTYNTYGLYADRTTNSGPNALSFFGHRFGLNAEYALKLVGGSSLNVSGGSIEGNGVGGTGNERGGVILENPGGEGGVAATFTGVYFEANQGRADLFMSMGQYPVTLNAFGSHFNRVDDFFATNAIRVESPAGSARAVVNVSGTAFRGYNNYQPSSSRPYISFTPGSLVTLNDAGALYGSDQEYPTIPTNRVLARVRFNPTTVASGDIPLISSSGIASVSKTSTGTYNITLSEITGSPRKTAVVFADNPVMPVQFGQNTNQLQVRLFDTPSSLKDPTDVSIVIYDN